MRDFLLAQLADEERSFAAGLREDPTLDYPNFARQLFAEMRDPLLSAQDVAELWGEGAAAAEVVQALDGLVTEGILEASDVTQRPFDPKGTRLYRSSSNAARRLTLTALESQAPDGASRFQLSVEGRLVRGLARIDRLDAISGEGQQRDEIRAHVERIRDSIKGGTHVPNPVLLVLLESATQVVEYDEEEPQDIPSSFTIVRALEEFPAEEGETVQRSRLVELSVPWRRSAFDDEKSILLVDGQQRTAAIALVGTDEVPFVDLGISAVIASEAEAKRVFQVANETVKISTDFSKALLASMDATPGYLRDEAISAEVVRRLALENADSPFYNLVKYPGAAARGGVIAYNSLFGLVQSFRKGLPEDVANDVATMTTVIGQAFAAVKDTWPDAWGSRPNASKLMHGAGLRAVSQVALEKLQNYLSAGHDLATVTPWEMLKASLERLATRVVWTDSAAAGGTATQKKYWREEISGRQNTNQDISALSAFLTRESVSLDMRAARGR